MILSPDWFIFLAEYWWDAREYHCMTHTDMVVDTFTHPGTMHIGGDNWLTRPFEVEGQGIKELPGYFWIIKYFGICQNQVGTEAPTVVPPSMILAPNPVSDLLLVSWPAPFSGHLEVFSLAGKQVLRQAVQQSATTEIEVGQLPAGLYFLSALNAGGQRSVQRFVVLR